jgi:FkbM family methyltransferase
MSSIDLAPETPVHWTDRFVRSMRHAKGLKRLGPLWNAFRPVYGKFLKLLYPRGVEWTINGTDRIRLSTDLRMISAEHEPAPWHLLMNETRTDDTIADVGANIGMYTLPWAKRLGPAGRVVAFEPDTAMFNLLKENVALNKVADRVQLVKAAVGADNHSRFLCAGIEALCYVSVQQAPNSVSVEGISLDQFFSRQPFNILKIDVEGFEEEVLKGALGVLSSSSSTARLLYVELHPWAWARSGLATTQKSIEALLMNCGYSLEYLDGDGPDKKGNSSQLIARKKPL